MEWQGPLVNLTHTLCMGCGAVNCQEDERWAEQFTDDFMAGLVEINKLGGGATLVDVACAMMRHISPHVESVTLSGSRKIPVSDGLIGCDGAQQGAPNYFASLKV